MNAEIELKLFFELEHQQQLISLLNGLSNTVVKKDKQLVNRYFDTSAQELQQWKMGLRVRQCDRHQEQTIKTSGTVVGGLHSRPEYNVDIPLEQQRPDLTLFPTDIWPQGCDINQLQQRLICIFNTDFLRKVWHVKFEHALIEVAIDVGTITAQGVTDSSETICELELELLEGDPQALFDFAIVISQQIPVRLGKASKAQRGYKLATQASPLSLDALDYISLNSELELVTSLTVLLSTALERWQVIESMAAEAVDVQLSAMPILCYRMRGCIRLIHNALIHFNLLNDELTEDFNKLEQHLSFIEEGLSWTELEDNDAKLLANLPHANQLIPLLKQQLRGLDMDKKFTAMLLDPCYGQLQLQLSLLLFKLSNKRQVLTEQMPLVQFAQKLQESSWQIVVSLLPQGLNLSIDDYFSLAKVLDTSMLVGIAYGELYPVEPREQFRKPWQDLVLGIKTQLAYRYLHKLAEMEGLDIAGWLESREQSLLFAMEQTRLSALKSQPYWR